MKWIRKEATRVTYMWRGEEFVTTAIRDEAQLEALLVKLRKEFTGVRAERCFVLVPHYEYEELKDLVGVTPDPDSIANAYPKLEDFQCSWTDYHNDMYPEFAPDPVVDRCTAPATVILAGWEPEADPSCFGLPSMDAYCREHADLIEQVDPDYPNPMVGRLTRIERPTEDLQHRVERINQALVSGDRLDDARERITRERGLLNAELDVRVESVQKTR